jgi:hypothetical protein
MISVIPIPDGDWQTSQDASPAVDVSHLKDLQVIASKEGGTLTLDVQISPDGTNWYDWATDQNGAVATKIPAALKVRINTSAWTSGTPAAWIMGSRA